MIRHRNTRKMFFYNAINTMRLPSDTVSSRLAQWERVGLIILRSMVRIHHLLFFEFVCVCGARKQMHLLFVLLSHYRHHPNQQNTTS